MLLPVLRLPVLPFLLSLLTALPALAQQEPPAATLRPERLYLPGTGVLLGSSRVVALGGAFVGIAEGAEGFPTNLAALAHRPPHLARDWDVDFTLSWLALPLSSALGKDLDNDGQPDETPVRRQLLGGVLLQYRHFGLGFFMRTGALDYCASAACEPAGRVGVSLTTTALAGAAAFGDDDFLLAFGLYAAEARFDHLGDTWRYGSTALAFDLLYRPLGRPYRIGVAVRPQVVGGWLAEDGQLPVVAGRQLYSAVVAPGVLSVGASYRLGEGSERYNRLSPAALGQAASGGLSGATPPPEALEPPAGRWLVSGQVDIIGSAQDAVPVRSFTQDSEPERVGGRTLFQPRIGVEHETLPGVLRLRGGGFIEPSPFAQALPRPHLTGGLELYLFRYWQRWSLSASFDLARRYTNLGLSVGFWR